MNLILQATDIKKYVQLNEDLIHIIEDDQLNTLLEGSQWPAILHYREGSTEIIYVAFDPLESNWPYLRSFPFFVYNTIQFLGRNGETLAFHPKQIGESVSFPIPPTPTSNNVESGK